VIPGSRGEILRRAQGTPAGRVGVELDLGRGGVVVDREPLRSGDTRSVDECIRRGRIIPAPIEPEGQRALVHRIAPESSAWPRSGSWPPRRSGRSPRPPAWLPSASPRPNRPPSRHREDREVPDHLEGVRGRRQRVPGPGIRERDGQRALGRIRRGRAGRITSETSPRPLSQTESV